MQRARMSYNRTDSTIILVATRDRTVASFCHFLLPAAFRLLLTRYSESSYNQVPVAQLDRVSASGAEGSAFESRRGYLSSVRTYVA